MEARCHMGEEAQNRSTNTSLELHIHQLPVIVIPTKI